MSIAFRETEEEKRNINFLINRVEGLKNTSDVVRFCLNFTSSIFQKIKIKAFIVSDIKDGKGDEDVPKEIREEILKRDGYRCKECNKLNTLIIHHIDNNRHNNSFENLTTICRSCHAKIHSDLNGLKRVG